MSEQKFEHFQQVLVRNDEKNVWVCDFYSHYRENPCLGYNHICTGGEDWKYCLPYEGNKHLAGTCENLKQEEKLRFGDKLMVSNNHTDWRKATFINYAPEDSGYNYRVCTPNGIFCFKHCRKGWDNDDE